MCQKKMSPILNLLPISPNNWPVFAKKIINLTIDFQHSEVNYKQTWLIKILNQDASILKCTFKNNDN